MQSVRTVQCKQHVRWRSGWSRGLSRFTNDFRVKGGDGHGQLGSVGDHFWGKYILVRRTDGATCAGRLLYEVQAPCGTPRNTQNRPRTARQPHPGATWGRRGPRHSETSRPGDPADCNVFNWPGIVHFFSLPSFRGMWSTVLCCTGQKDKTSVWSRHSTLTSFRHPCILSSGTAPVTSSPIHPKGFCRVARAGGSGTAV